MLTAVAAPAGFAIPGAYAAESHGEVEIRNVVLDGGKDVVVETYDKTVTVSGTFTHPSGIQDADFVDDGAASVARAVRHQQCGTGGAVRRWTVLAVC